MNWLLYIVFFFVFFFFSLYYIWTTSNVKWINIDFDFDSMYEFVCWTYTPCLNSLTAFYVSGSYFIKGFYHLTVKEK